MYKIIISTFLLFSFISCKKLIEVQETDFIPGSIAFKTVEHTESGIIGAYAGLQVEMGYLLNSSFSDEVKTAGEFYNSISTHEWQYSADDVTIRDNFTAIAAYYNIINRVNQVLQALPNVDSTRVGDNTLKLRLRGEGVFLRAFCHFELFRYYSGNYDPNGLAMPYMEVSTQSTPQLNQARLKMSEYIPKLLADIAEAKNLLPNNLTDVFRATKLAAAGLQARVALYTRDWANAETYASEYIDAIPLAPRASFAAIWTDANNLEQAWKLDRTSTFNPYGRIGSLYRGTSSSSSGTGIGIVTWAPSSKLWDSYDQTNDIRFSSYLKNETALAAVGRQSRLVAKYAGTGYATSNENVADAKIFRTGEMYLIRAEARAELGKLSGATNSTEYDINTLRAARINGYVPVTFASKDAAIDAIMQERFKELAFEGHRFWDLRRRNLPVIRTGTDAPSPTGAILSAGHFRFVLPIPNSEMQANKLMVQNPGY